MLRRAGFFGRMLTVRIDFGYWVFEGDLQPIQRPCWNYRSRRRRRHHPRHDVPLALCARQPVRRSASPCPASARRTSRKRWDEAGKPYTRHRRRRRLRHLELEGDNGEPVIAQINMIWATRVRRDDLVTFHVDGTHGSAVAGLQECRAPGAREHAAAGVEPRREADDELLRPVAGRARHPDLRQRLQDRSGSPSSATWSKTRPIAGPCPKAPRACSWSRPRCRAGRSGAGSTCRRWRCEAMRR